MFRRRVGVAVAVAACAALVGTYIYQQGPEANAADRASFRPLSAASGLFKSGGLCLSAQAVRSAGADVQNCDAGRRWTTTAAGEIKFGEMCLDVKGQGTGNGTPVILYPCHGGANQKWKVGSNGTVRSEQSRKCLDVKGGGRPSLGTLVQIFRCHGRSNQRWTVADGSSGETEQPPVQEEPSAAPPAAAEPPAEDGGGGGVADGKNSNAIGSVAADKSGPNVAGFQVLRDYRFGTGAGRNTSDLSKAFNPFGIAGTDTINREAQKYVPFNSTNHNVTANGLELTAVRSGGSITSGQIATKETFFPHNGALVFKLRAKVPQQKKGAWPAFWMYRPSNAGTDGSLQTEIDIFEFFDSPTQSSKDWTGFNHDKNGKDVSNFHNKQTNEWVFAPGMDFGADFHTYSLVWRPDNKIEKWVDGTFVKGSDFTWVGPAPQVLINLALGGFNKEGKAINNQPDASTFAPDGKLVFAVDSFQVLIKCEDGGKSCNDVE